MKAFEAVPVAANPTYGLMKKGLGMGLVASDQMGRLGRSDSGNPAWAG